MKKIFSTLALAACALVASAQVLIPSGFNYQGHTSEPDGTEATFNVVDAAGKIVYTQTETLKVTANGTFTVVIGNDADESWNTINWSEGGYTIVTKIKDNTVSTAKLQYVPYAAYATDYAGREYVEQTLNEIVPEIAPIKAQLAEQALINENLEGLVPVVETLVEDSKLNEDEHGMFMTEIENVNKIGIVLEKRLNDVEPVVEALAAGVDVLENDLREQVQANREQATDIAELKLDVESVGLAANKAGEIAATTYELMVDTFAGIDENMAMSNEIIDTLLEAKDQNADEHEYLLSEIENVNGVAIVLEKRLNEVEPQVEANTEALAIVSDDLQGVVESLRGYVPVAKYEADLANIDENIAMSNEIIDALLEAKDTNESEHGMLLNEIENVNSVAIILERRMNEAEAAIIENTDALANVSSDVQGLQEKMRGIVTIDQYNADMANIDENVAKFNEIIDVLLEQKDANDEAIAYISSDVQGLQEKMRGLATIESVNEVEATLMNVAENANMAAQTAQAAYDKADSLQDAIDYVTSDVQGIQEVLRGKADVEDYTSMKEAIDELRRQIANNAAAIAGLTALINR